MMEVQLKTQKSAGVIIFRKEKEGPIYLLLQNSSKKFWDFAKGNIDSGESEEDAAMREVKEETGLVKVEIIPGFKEKVHYFFRLHGELISKDLVMFVGEEKEGEEIKLSWEHSDQKWVFFDEAKKMLKPGKLRLLEKAHKFLSGQLGNWTN